MILTEKETNAIEDLKTQEQACIEKYTKYSNQAKDPVLKELFEEIVRVLDQVLMEMVSVIMFLHMRMKNLSKRCFLGKKIKEKPSMMVTI